MTTCSSPRPKAPNAPQAIPGIPVPVLIVLFLVVANLPLAIAAWTTKSSGHFATELGAAAAIVAASLLYLQFLSSGRFEALSGKIGIDRTMGFHRIAGVALLAFALVHPMSYVGGLLLEDPRAAASLLHALLSSTRLRSGVVALVLLMLIVGFALIRTKRFVRYEFWRGAHGPIAVVAAGLTLHHAVTAGRYSADPSLRAVWLIYACAALVAAVVVYLVRPWRMWRSDWRIETARAATDGITELVLRGPEQTGSALRGGQFLWMTVSPHRPPFHDHPFSIASSAGFLPRLRLIIRRAGNCTDTFDSIAPGTRVAVDGPHGSFTLPSRTSAIAMIAGGVGIAPLLGMLEEAAERSDRRPFRLLYAARREAAFVGKERLAELSNQLDLKIMYCADEGSLTPTVLRGPISKDHLTNILSGLVPDDLSVMLCGPPPMMERAADTLLSLGVPMPNIHYERFDYGAGRGKIDRWRRFTALTVLMALMVTALAFSLR